MRVYGMFVQIVQNGYPFIVNEGWRFEGISANEDEINQFRKRVQQDIDATKDAITKTVGYRVVQINK